LATTFDVAAFINNRKLSSFNYRLIVLSWLITVFDGLDMMMISYTAPYIKDAMGLDKAMLGRVFSAALLGMMLGGFFFSYLGDRIGRRIAVIVAAFAFGVLTMATSLAQSYEQLLLLRFVDGFAIGGMLPLAWALNIEFVPTRLRSTVVTVIMVGYSLGSALSGPLTNLLAPTHGWPAVFLAGGAGTLVCATLLLFGLPESVRFLVSKNRRPELVASTLNRVDRTIKLTGNEHFKLGDEAIRSQHFTINQLFEGRLRWMTPLLWLGYIASTLAVYFIASWGPMVMEELKVARTTTAWLGSISGMTGATAGLCLMRFTDRKGPYAVAFFPLLALPILLTIGFGHLSQSVFIPVAVLGSALISGAHFGILSIAGVYYPSAIRANGGGWATSMAKVGGIAGPMIGAVILSSHLPVVRSYALLALCPLTLALCAIGLGTIVRRHPA
jgi:MFS transporter, AAHS family, 4-hydroxybenzoate transporter